MAQFDIHPNEAGHTAIFNTAYTAITGKAYTAPTSSSSIGVTYVSQVQRIGWQKFANDGVLSGTTGKSLRDEAVQIKLTGDFPAGASIIYQAYVQKLAWLKKVSDGQTAGTTGKALRLEALRITLSGLTGYEVQYRVHVQGIGWQAWQTTTNGTDISAAVIAGTTGQSRRLEAIKIRIVKMAG
jgi:N-acetylmuramoyl-L-alanine amidase